MARFRLVVPLAAGATLLAASLVFAQAGSGRGQGARMYDPATETTVTGTVDAVKEMSPQGRRGMGGLHLTLKTEAESIEVHLGPMMYLHEKGLRIENGDRLTILGSRITFEGAPAIVARQITKDGETVTLRDDAGRPLWAGGRSR